MNLREFAQQFVECPCCATTDECLPGCTYADDAPESAETMRAAREAIRLCGPSPTQQKRRQGATFRYYEARECAECFLGTHGERNPDFASDKERLAAFLLLACNEIDRLRAELATWHRSVLEAQVPKRRKETDQ